MAADGRRASSNLIGRRAAELERPRRLICDIVAAPAATLDAAFGARRLPVNAGSALGSVVAPAGPLAMLGTVVAIMRHVGGARLTGRWRDTPLFRVGATPVVAPQVLTRAERHALDDRG